MATPRQIAANRRNTKNSTGPKSQAGKQRVRITRLSMDSLPPAAADQAAEYRGLIKKAQSKDEAEVLKNISSSWSRLAGQIDRYSAIVREQRRTVSKK